MAVSLVLVAAACAPQGASNRTASRLTDIQHIVVIYLENWSFDSLYGHFPGADGLAGAGRTTQVDKNGVAYPTLPQPLANPTPAAPPDPRFPTGLPDAPFDLATYVPPVDTIGDLTGRFYQEQAQIDGGRMDRFVAYGGAGGLPLGSYDATMLPLGRLAAQYTLADNFFHAAFGGSLLNHFWLISGATPRWDTAPASMRAIVGADGKLEKDGAVTPEGFLVNTAYPEGGPHPLTTPAGQLVPPLSGPTIGDRLNAKGVSWAWYAGGWRRGQRESRSPFPVQPSAVHIFRQLRERHAGRRRSFEGRDRPGQRHTHGHPSRGEYRRFDRFHHGRQSLEEHRDRRHL